jgi:hypothetical protein
MANHDGLDQSTPLTKPGKIVCEYRHRIVLIWRIALAMSAQIDRNNPMRLAEKLSLCGERGMIAAPPMNQDHWQKARVYIFVSKSDSVFLNQLHKLPDFVACHSINDLVVPVICASAIGSRSRQGPYPGAHLRRGVNLSLHLDSS